MSQMNFNAEAQRRRDVDMLLSGVRLRRDRLVPSPSPRPSPLGRGRKPASHRLIQAAWNDGILNWKWYNAEAQRGKKNFAEWKSIHR